MVRSSMKCAGTSWPSGFLRRPVSIGWLIKSRISATSPSIFERTLIAFAMVVVESGSAAAPAQRDFDLLHRVIEFAFRFDERKNVARLIHLHARLDIGQRPRRDVEGRRERIRILLDEDGNRLGAGDLAADLERYHRAIFRDLGPIQDHQVAGLRRAAAE